MNCLHCGYSENSLSLLSSPTPFFNH
ncbi:hypothetical protein Golob_011659, partial [Gossypium lobatum]|nr:hypothetical protein [Gossypium lobatum]